MKFIATTANTKTEIEARDWIHAERRAKVLAWIMRTTVTLVKGHDAMVINCPKNNPTA